jgi:hypothetical protein
VSAKVIMRECGLNAEFCVRAWSFTIEGAAPSNEVIVLVDNEDEAGTFCLMRKIEGREDADGNPDTLVYRGNYGDLQLGMAAGIALAKEDYENPKKVIVVGEEAIASLNDTDEDYGTSYGALLSFLNDEDISYRIKDASDWSPEYRKGYLGALCDSHGYDHYEYIDFSKPTHKQLLATALKGVQPTEGEAS